MKVLIDNGHGENTPGKRSPDGRLREWAYSREIADLVVAGLRKLGIDAERIVKEDTDVPYQSAADVLMLFIMIRERKLFSYLSIVMLPVPVQAG